MKVALVCDWLTESGGAEAVIKKFHKMYPSAPIFTSQYRKGRTKWLKNAEVKTGYLNFFPVCARRFLAPLRQNYFKNLNLDDFDLVISITGCDAKFVQTTGYHLCYCHAPTQYYFGKREEYLKNPGFGILNPLVRPFFRKLLPKLRANDLAAAKKVDEFIAPSNFEKQEIKRFYKREAKVVSPPVNHQLFAQAVDNKNIKKGKSQANRSEQNFYLNYSRQVSWKRLDILVKCCIKYSHNLILVGDGPEHKKLVRLAKNSKNIRFLDHLEQDELIKLLKKSKAFLFPSEEPFGLAPVEALAAGCPVIAYKNGGAKDFIKNGENGLFFDKQTPESLEKAIRKFEDPHFSFAPSKKISKSAEKFSEKNFERNFQKIVAKIAVGSNSPAKSKNSQISPKSAETSPESRLDALRHALVLCLPVVLFFSNFPVVKLAETSTMHIELTLPLLWLALFSVLSLKPALNYAKKHLKTPLLAFPIYLIISLISSLIRGEAISRATLTFGVIFCLLISIIGLRIHLKSHPLPKTFKKFFLLETCAVCIFCLLQCLFDYLGVDKNLTLLCDGCTSGNFGFPRPNGFAIEPQFMGSLLLAPLIVAIYSGAIVPTLIIFTTLFLTLSRGAIFAALLAVLFLFIKLKHKLKIALLTIVSFILSLILMVSFSNVSPLKTIDTAISQLSLGKISLNLKNDEFPEPPIETNFAVSENCSNSHEPCFTGYIAESTDRRLELATFAVKISIKNPTNLLFGTGLGSAGTEMYRHFPEKQGHAKEIVQNTYLEALLELGALGLVALALTITTFLKLEKSAKQKTKTKSPRNRAKIVLLLAYAVSITFFSGLENALHLYLLPVFMI